MIQLLQRQTAINSDYGANHKTGGTKLRNYWKIWAQFHIKVCYKHTDPLEENVSLQHFIGRCIFRLADLEFE